MKLSKNKTFLKNERRLKEEKAKKKKKNQPPSPKNKNKNKKHQTTKPNHHHHHRKTLSGEDIHFGESEGEEHISQSGRK